MSLYYCQVIIITNSDEGWVKYSAEKFVPRLLPFLAKLKIISARTRYEKFYPQSSLCWKSAAFAHECHELFQLNGAYADNNSEKSYDSLTLTDVSSASDDSMSPQSHSSSTSAPMREIISFGDGMEERTAVRIVSEQLTSIPKSVMFLQSPTPVQIIGQLVMLTNHMKYVCQHETNLDLEISEEQADSCAERYIKKHNLRVEGEFMGETTGVTTVTARADREQCAGSTVPLSVTL